MGALRQKRTNRKRRYRNEREIEEANKRAFKEAAWRQRICQARDCRETVEWEAHHVVEKQVLRLRFMADRYWDTRNSMRLCPGCHSGHTVGYRRVLLTDLSDENYEFAFDALGVSAYDELARKYDGRDPRLEEWLAKTEARAAEQQRTLEEMET